MKEPPLPIHQLRLDLGDIAADAVLLGRAQHALEEMLRMVEGAPITVKRTGWYKGLRRRLVDEIGGVQRYVRPSGS